MARRKSSLDVETPVVVEGEEPIQETTAVKEEPVKETAVAETVVTVVEEKTKKDDKKSGEKAKNRPKVCIA